MENIVQPYKIFKRPANQEGKVRFIFTDLEKYQIMFQATLDNEESFSSINVKSLEKHFNYGYRYQNFKDGKWTNIQQNKNIFVEYEDKEIGLKYSYYEYKGSDKLYVIFSSSTIEQTYNYVSSLRNLKENKLFLLDENLEGIKFKSSYYIGFNKEKNYEKKIITLIEKKMLENNLSPEAVVLIGSSKGGFSALYYTFKYNFKTAIVGSPTIYLGENHKETKFGKSLISHITGEYNEDNIKWLDNLIINEASNSKHNPEIFYHVGNKEVRYFNHAIPFIKYLNANNLARVHLDLGEYEKHSEVGKYFVNYFSNQLSLK